MLVIRLQRTGRKNLPAFRLVLAEKARPVKGKFLEILGHYLPARTPPVFEWQGERIAHWMSQGAHPSNTVARLLRKTGLNNMEKFIKPYVKRKPKNVQEPQPLPPPTSSGSP